MYLIYCYLLFYLILIILFYCGRLVNHEIDFKKWLYKWHFCQIMNFWFCSVLFLDKVHKYSYSSTWLNSSCLCNEFYSPNYIIICWLIK